MNGFLPVGSVVLLKDATRPVVVIGYTVVEKGDNRVWDYLGCAYPIGVIGTDKNLLFQKSQISKVLFLGYSDSEGKEFLAKLDSTLNEIKKQFEKK